MGERVIKMPDVGEGVAEAELVEWKVKIGDLVREDDILGAVMTDKATVEIPSPVPRRGSLARRRNRGNRRRGFALDPAPGGRRGGAQARRAGGEAAAAPRAESPRSNRGRRPRRGRHRPRPFQRAPSARRGPRARSRSPRPRSGCAPRRRESTCARFREPAPRGASAIRTSKRSSPAAPQIAPATGLRPNNSVKDVKLVGLRRKIAERMALANSHIPHITYVEEVDVGALEELRAALNKQKRPAQPKLTLLPFLMRAMVKAIADQPHLNALFDDEAGIVHQHGGVHIGIAAQTAAGLVVPVVRHAEARDLWDCGAELVRLAEVARTGTATREELSGSTITITSLGAMGGVATTPIINYPEVAIVGVNKIMTRPVWDGSGFVPRKMMNLTSSFDHRVVDGWDAAVFVQRIKTLLETPAMIFVEG